MPMKILIAVGITALLAAVGSAWYLDAREPRKPYPKATPPPDPSPIYHPSKEPVLTEEEIELAEAQRVDFMVSEIGQALSSPDSLRRETAFTFLLPELLQVEPARAVEMLADQEPGAERDLLRREVARQWANRDLDAAVKWMQSLPGEAERHDSAREAMDALAFHAPEQARRVSAELGLDGGDPQPLRAGAASD